MYLLGSDIACLRFGTSDGNIRKHMPMVALTMLLFVVLDTFVMLVIQQSIVAHMKATHDLAFSSFTLTAYKCNRMKYICSASTATAMESCSRAFSRGGKSARERIVFAAVSLNTSKSDA